ncbi:MAG: DUF1553 domain-containing protein, partial [Pirellulaceae bacterium]|nr:DUF1553 domain-containing protein [Pirellulaceae bacterium]
NPLFPRVIVNRLWQYHFGHGLVETSSDFGFNGGLPSHPELLDALAEQLIANDYQLKALQRALVTSETYRQSSDSNAAAVKIDAGNRWLWRMSPTRLDAETLRDAMLLMTNRLDKQVGGRGYRDMRHFFYKGSNFYESIVETGSEARRRTIYRFIPRGGNNAFLTTFDCPDPSATTPRRAVTTTPLQALALLNNPFTFEMSDALAERIKTQVGENQPQQIELAYLIVFNRPANDDEIQRCQAFVQQHDLPALCRILLNSNEFLYVR